MAQTRETSSPLAETEAESPRIEANLDLEDDDRDSAIDSGSLISSTISLSESIFDYRKLHGRTYQNTKTAEYWAPNDEKQNDGLDLIHNACLMLMDDKLFLAPLEKSPGRVLDVGTGTGIWAIDFADQYPETEVIGTDLSPIQPAWVPPNVKFMIDDCLLDWTWPENHFDFIHIRALYGSVADWGELYKKAFRHLKPGKWFQDLEMGVRFQSDHVQYPEDHVFNELSSLVYEAGEKTGRTFRICEGNTMKEHMEAAGFVDIVEKKIKAPLHGWPKDPRLQQAGLLLQLAFDESLEGLNTFLLTQVLGWQTEEAMLLQAKMRKESRKISNYHWFQITIVYGRKPDESEQQFSTG
ncbi:S-adenosyl-L-methionine-dependent methyltransferase [Ilyonectria sp. MPI-CAGE-AT-0026]|nr:S-adenosyl-L-methionine-dependent methyltransferase [Ilyonectria sp. MPI-CAGE-AT-0026]